MAYELIEGKYVSAIECSKEGDTTKCFRMLQKWLQTKINSCFCELFHALDVYDLHGIIERVKEIIMK